MAGKKKTTRGPGRPPSLDPKSEAILVRLTPRERKLLARAAGELPLATWMRNLAIAAAKREVG